ncbi:sll0922 [Synechocystis sp. PCC 6803]|uniref:Sll0922 protein n=1 Tax=Synechocystis sp. (strain ATCC 27184 / PCC 6803 / Kazusa) TaxID=1111708 RepID=P72878_SYNY3|nr:hypothetical protein MYO_13220 [Synechocystis sp. PCC 6803]AVP88503.1 hypothetical protein C7I86_01655 [Synechocystis sp. IPPAS B-1465]BAL28065.1 hypothetical protein SYNGTI_0318 [Synechocystis sp. PCC 6803 substr. GT-I]BAL31235.1 hypothetical protein SYNPCCN_0318 [Synechocystis sp. PCC 6803 substr. PCC-N]BAL34404.1 hypothetical protein SYNPCCP_0318 [Synechocystis sp. PCC 6803 substr. PCC-P]BAM50605.1 hypothetical protein BEST7613_1674 [Synechocystis sp. PCC 6803] [Bacillus subtilis BEST761
MIPVPGPLLLTYCPPNDDGEGPASIIMACPKWAEILPGIYVAVLPWTANGSKLLAFHRLHFLFLATGILHTFLAWSKNTADETEICGTVEAPARVEKRKFNCFYKKKTFTPAESLY